MRYPGCHRKLRADQNEPLKWARESSDTLQVQLIQVCNSTVVELNWKCFGDASFEALGSQSGIVVQVGGATVAWRSARQASVATSTAESEACAMMSAVQMSEGAEALLASGVKGVGRGSYSSAVRSFRRWAKAFKGGGEPLDTLPVSELALVLWVAF